MRRGNCAQDGVMGRSTAGKFLCAIFPFPTPCHDDSINHKFQDGSERFASLNEYFLTEESPF